MKLISGEIYMNKYVFWSISFIYSLIYVVTSPNASGDIPSVFGGSLGTWVWLGLFAYGITHLGKGRKNPSRNTVAFWVSTVLFGLLMFNNFQDKILESNLYSQEHVSNSNNISENLEDPADILVNYLEKHNALYALLMQKNPAFKTEMKQVVKGLNPNSPLLRKWNETHSLDVVDLEAIPSVMGLLEKEFSKYMRFASDQDIYDMYQTEYNHMVKNNCQVFPIPEEDRQETIRIKSKLVNNSINNPYKGEVMSEEEAAKAFKQIGAYYGKKGYGIGDLMIILEGGKNLSRTEQCRAVKQFYEAILSLPKATSGKLVRTISQ